MPSKKSASKSRKPAPSFEIPKEIQEAPKAGLVEQTGVQPEQPVVKIEALETVDAQPVREKRRAVPAPAVSAAHFRCGSALEVVLSPFEMFVTLSLDVLLGNCKRR